ncbi:CU044_5270 family protein [Microtetraspora niveoalba]|uniref:CU044_5270 family protein n=1 Tax=Microtetraspora niveoalba TaxID=46175 RepID=UPI0008363EEC|nr:CU044_5270 family protein [Microtetraspora niveoalba]
MNLTDLARVHDDDLGGDPAGQASGPGARALLASITAEPPGQGGRPRAKRLRVPAPWLASAVGLAAAVTLVVTLVAVPDGQIPKPPQATASPEIQPSARQVLLAAATAAMKAPSSGAYWRTVTISGMDATSPDRGYIIRRRFSKEEWLARRPGGQGWRIRQYLGAKPPTDEDETAWRKAGSPTQWKYPLDMTGLVGATSSEVVRAAAEEKMATQLPRSRWKGVGGTLTADSITWDEIRRIPSGERELRAYLEQRFADKKARGDYGDDPRWHEGALQGACMEIVFGLPVSPAVRASAYRILATLPGMTALGRVKDPLGRTGEALGYRVNGNQEGEGDHQIVEVIDPETGLPLSQSSTSTVKLADGRTAKVENFTAYKQMGWTDEKPSLPAKRD